MLWVCMLAGVLIGDSLAAQSVSVRIHADKSSVLIGEPFWFTIETKTLNGVRPSVMTIDTIPHFELIVKDSMIVGKRGDTGIYQHRFQLRSFDSGRWVLPVPSVNVEPITVDVVFTENFNPQQPYHDVKEVTGVSAANNIDWEVAWYIAAAVLLLVLVLYKALRPAKPKTMQPMPMTPQAAYDKALRMLKTLKAESLDQKEKCTQLVQIFRTYLLERVGITSMQHTSSGLLEYVHPLMKDEAKYKDLFEVLELCERVKFAKYHPTENEAAFAQEAVRIAVEHIEWRLKH